MAQNTARVVGFVALPVVQETRKVKAKSAPKSRPLSSVVDVANDPRMDRPVIRLPSGKERAVESIRVIPHMGFADVTMVTDLADGGKQLVQRVSLNTPCVGWSKVVQKPEVIESI
jgi:hypothetical protein